VTIDMTMMILTFCVIGLILLVDLIFKPRGWRP